MKQRIKIYTTTKSHWFRENFEFIKESLEQSQGREIEEFSVETFSPPTSIPTYTWTNPDGTKTTRPSWDWFVERFTEKAEGYNVVVLHMSEYYKKKWGISKWIGGTYRRDPDTVMEFWLVADRFDPAKGYTFDQFTRRFIHEMLHGDTYFASIKYWDGDPRQWVHVWDYDIKKVHDAPMLIDYTNHDLMVKLVSLLEKIVVLYRKLL